MPKLMKALQRRGWGEVPVVTGGIVPDEDEGKLKKAVKETFHPGAREIVSKVARLAGSARREGREVLARRAGGRHGLAVPARMDPLWLAVCAAAGCCSLPATHRRRRCVQLCAGDTQPGSGRCASKTASKSIDPGLQTVQPCRRCSPHLPGPPTVC